MALHHVQKDADVVLVRVAEIPACHHRRADAAGAQKFVQPVRLPGRKVAAVYKEKMAGFELDYVAHAAIDVALIQLQLI